MKSETLKQILAAVPSGKLDEVCRISGKSKNTYYNVLKHQIHRNATLVTAALDTIEADALAAIALVQRARKELAEDMANPKQLKRQKQAA